MTATAGRRTVRIRNRLGLHARAAARFVQTANRFRARITVSRDGRTMDGKSILGMLLLAASAGTVLELRAEGEDAEAALDALGALVESGLGEEPELAPVPAPTRTPETESEG